MKVTSLDALICKFDINPNSGKAILSKLLLSQARWHVEDGSPSKHSKPLTLWEYCHHPHQIHPKNALCSRG